LNKPLPIIREGLVLGPAGDVAPRDLLIEDGRILAIDNPGFGVSEDAETVSASDRMLILGIASSHTHAHGALIRGAVEDKVSLEMFLTGAGASTRSRGIDDKYLSAALSAAEMIRKGCTACFDLTVEFPGPSRDGISAVARPRLSRFRHARGGGADDCRPHHLPGAAGPAGSVAGRTARATCQHARGA